MGGGCRGLKSFAKKRYLRMKYVCSGIHRNIVCRKMARTNLATSSTPWPFPMRGCKLLSARRHTHRATCKCEAARPPPGTTKVFSGGVLASSSSMHACVDCSTRAEGSTAVDQQEEVINKYREAVFLASSSLMPSCRKFVLKIVREMSTKASTGSVTERDRERAESRDG